MGVLKGREIKMKILKREIIYTCEIEWTNTKGQKQITEIECDNKCLLKRASGIIGNDCWKILKEEVLSIDPNAFIVVNDCYDVNGGVKKESLPFV